MTKKQTFLLILLVFLFVLFLIAGIYFFLKPKSSITIYKADRYQDLVNWCDAKVNGDKLNLSCKALLLEIKIIDENHNCAELQVITRNKELKDISICESNEEIVYSNDVLGYKRLMPIDISAVYMMTDIPNNYSFSNISATKLNDTYVQEIVNTDLKTLVNTPIDRVLTEMEGPENISYLGTEHQDTYTITNSIDFCPKVDSLPSYVTNPENYNQFYNKYILQPGDYLDLSEERQFMEIFKKLYACDSSAILGYNVCDLSKKITPSLIPDTLMDLSTNRIIWEPKIDLMSRIYLKKINAIYNNIYVYKNPDTKYIDTLDTLIYEMNREDSINETTFCSMYKIYDSLSKVDSSFNNKKDFIKTTVNTNLRDVKSRQCLGIFSESEIDLQGAYLKVYFSNLNDNGIFRIYNQCTNLSSIIN